jgi:hypothetical protein
MGTAYYSLTRYIGHPAYTQVPSPSFNTIMVTTKQVKRQGNGKARLTFNTIMELNDPRAATNDTYSYLSIPLWLQLNPYVNINHFKHFHYIKNQNNL